MANPVSVSSSAIIGHLREFSLETTEWAIYKPRLEQYFIANGITDDAKKRAVLLNACGDSAYRLIFNLCVPNLPESVAYAELILKFNNHFGLGQKSVFPARYSFYTARREKVETIANWSSRVRNLASHCKFGTELETVMRDIFVIGLGKGATMDRLCEEKVSELTFQKAVELATNKETSMQFHSTESTPSGSFQVKQEPGHLDGIHRLRSNVRKVKCKVCGYSNHDAEHCRYRNFKCNFCSKIGHLASVCRDKKKNKKRNKYSGSTNTVHAVTEDFGLENLFMLKSEYNKPMLETVFIENVPIKFEVDTGASVSVIPKSIWEQDLPHVSLLSSNKLFKDYSGNKFKSIGVANVAVKYKSQTFMLNLYVMNNDSPPLMGREWLSKFKMGLGEVKSLSLIDNDGSVALLADQYKNVFSTELGLFTKEEVTLKIKDGTVPKFFNPRPLPFAMKQMVEKEIERLVNEKILKPVSFSRWGTPIVPVLKGNNTVRLCGDFKVTINPYLEQEKFPLPRIEVLFEKLQGGLEFTKLDLANAYLQIPVEKQSRELLTISTHKGLFQYTRLPFGISSAPSIFQRMMESILQGIDGVIIFLDDILITGSNRSEHMERIQKVLSKLQECGLKIALSKCDFFKTEIKYLGYIIDKDGLRPDPTKIEAITKIDAPKTVSELKSFLGMINYYHKFISNTADLLGPLYSLLRNETKFVWTKKCAEAFEKAKKCLTSLNVLVHYNSNLPVKLEVDASQMGVGAVISHIYPSGEERPIAYASRTLSESEKRYSQIEREALSIIFGVTKFYQYLFGRHFILLTDHKPLVSIFNPKKGLPQISANRIQRWAWMLSGFSFDIQYVESKRNNADALSRLPLASDAKEEQNAVKCLNYVSKNSELDSKEVQKHTESDCVLKQVIKYVQEGWPKKVSSEFLPYFKCKSQLHMEEECVMFGYRVVIPECMRSAVLKSLHRAHMDIVKTKSLARSYLWWPSMNSDIEKMIKGCISCARLQMQPEKAILKTWDWPNNPWSRLHIDYMSIKGKYFLVVDAHSKWLEVFHTASMTTTVTINILRSLFARFGLPRFLVSDNAPNFCSAEFKSFAQLNGITLQSGAPFHAATNGEAENAVKTVEKSLNAMLTDGCNNVNLSLNRFLMDYRNTPHCTTGVSPAELLIGRKLRNRLDLLKPNNLKFSTDNIVRNHVNHKQMLQKKYYRGKRDVKFRVGEEVMVRDYRNVNNPSWIKGIINKILGLRTYLVKIVELNIIWKRHVNQLRKFNSILYDNSLQSSHSSDRIQNGSIPISTTSFTPTNDENSNVNISDRPKRNIRPPDRFGF